MATNPLLAVAELGQSIWIDHLDRGRLASGEIRRMIADDGLRGVTSNPTIFEQAITGDRTYDAAIRALATRGKSAAEIYDALTIEDIRLAADEFRAQFDALDHRDGFVSLEVSPHLAYDTAATIAEARRLWRAVDRPNVLIKVPGTRPGLAAIEALIGEGISINITLLFGLDRYEQVVNAYFAGLEARASRGESVVVPSVASFFLSRIDTAVDAELDRRVREGVLPAARAARLRGRTAIASARLAYQRYKRMFAEPRFRALEARGARTQRVLWASTSTKNPAYGDTYYVDALIGADTIDTVPLVTFDAYRDHGHPAARLQEHLGQARGVHDELRAVGIDLDAVTDQLEREGVRKFSASYDHLLDVLAHEREHARAS
ncbi:MAG TPA: transaldolase [Kofleriaceae bacterium]|nr:transaldolase [Kofleriaceae bacterium]